VSELLRTLNKNELHLRNERLDDGWSLRSSYDGHYNEHYNGHPSTQTDKSGTPLPEYVGTALTAGPKCLDVLFADFDTPAVVSAIGHLLNGTAREALNGCSCTPTPGHGAAASTDGGADVPVYPLNNVTDTALWISWASELPLP
jgi:hypothetical protein